MKPKWYPEETLNETLKKPYCKWNPIWNPKEALKKPTWTFENPDNKPYMKPSRNPKWNSKETLNLKKP